jgi:kinesin family protein 1
MHATPGGGAARKSSGMHRVVVAARVRPYLDAEREMSNNPFYWNYVTVEDGRRVLLGNPKTPADVKTFKLDHAFNSFDPSALNYAAQTALYTAIGHPVLRSLTHGLDSSVVAYGGAMTGKSFTLFGRGETGPGAGLLPQLCADLFTLRTSAGLGYDAAAGAFFPTMTSLEVSVFDIHREHARDLLNLSEPAAQWGSSARSGAGLKVSESEDRQCILEGLTRVTVDSYADVAGLLQRADEMRQASLAGEEEGRTHLVVELSARFRSSAAGEVEGVVRFIDLGSTDRLDHSTATAEQLKASGAHNKSLAALGVYLAAAASSQPKIINYRDSLLTRVLFSQRAKERSHTVIIGTVAPTGIDHDETSSTLRFLAAIKPGATGGSSAQTGGSQKKK